MVGDGGLMQELGKGERGGTCMHGGWLICLEVGSHVPVVQYEVF